MTEDNNSKPDLCDLFNHYGSDKDRNGYAQIYHTLFSKLRDDKISMLEIGIGTMIPGVHSSMQGYALDGYKPGGSLRAWRDYFVNGRIVGADVQPDTQFSDEPRIETYLCNSTKKDEVDAFLKSLDNPQFDIIIDDGSHHDMDQLNTLRNFYPSVKPGGFYIVEDIYPGSKLSTCASLIGCCANFDPYFFVGVKNNICVIYKSPLNSKRQNY
jgi:demethylmacrocin O-methyltransferase